MPGSMPRISSRRLSSAIAGIRDPRERCHGLRRGRRDPEQVGYGGAVDFWRVVGFERDHRLALRPEMRLPSEALLEFRIEPLGPNEASRARLRIF